MEDRPSGIGPLRVGVAGLGVVGGGVLKLLQANAELISRRANRPVIVTAVAARDRGRDRGVSLEGMGWEDNAVDLARRSDVDVIVELIGGSNGPSLALAKAAFAHGKSLVTGNKAMLAHHGMELAQLAETAGVGLKFEAAVGGGIPVVKGMREGLAANSIEHVYGILNGTCNYILSTMEQEGTAFDVVLAEAQRLGYAEADPSFDIDGVDAAHKLSILATLAFGTQGDFPGVALEGIRQVSPVDIDYARALGYRIRLIGYASLEGGALYQRVSPALVPTSHPLAHVHSSLNAIVAQGNFVGQLLMQGRGAGEGPTASAVVADLIDLARGEFGPAFAIPTAALSIADRADPDAHVGRYYIRLTVADRPGVLAEITAVLRDQAVSVETVLQRAGAPRGAYLVLTTHETSRRAISRSLAAFEALDSVIDRPALMTIMDV
jgi:homoserine dehydrogenase